MGKLVTILVFLSFSHPLYSALEYSKIEHPGCPENAFCQKETGLGRQSWLDLLDLLNRKKISEQEANVKLQKENGIPISGWAQEEAGVLPRILMWDSPCKQHRKEAAKYYISEVFRKNLKLEELKSLPYLFFSKAIGYDQNKKIFSLTIPRGEAPLFIKNGYYYFLKEEEGKYYGLLINKVGDIRISHVEKIDKPAKEAICIKEQVDLFLREAPSPSFYQGYYCKDIWDMTSKTYKTMLFGWSCN